MQKRGLSQEGLKLVACVTMLLDHIGAVIVMDCFEKAVGADRGALLDLYELLRTVGRLAFPIYCFLLVEGSVHTRNPRCYGLRLLVAALLAEIPYDLALYGSISWEHQNVMVTLLLGFVMLEAMKIAPRLWMRLLLLVPFLYLAEWAGSDYGADGILLIGMFALTRELPHQGLVRFFGIWCVFSPFHLMALNWVGGFAVTVQELAAFAAIPIGMYDGSKRTKSRAVQWGFYLFYPVHLLVLYLIVRL